MITESPVELLSLATAFMQSIGLTNIIMAAVVIMLVVFAVRTFFDR